MAKDGELSKMCCIPLLHSFLACKLLCTSAEDLKALKTMVRGEAHSWLEINDSMLKVIGAFESCSETHSYYFVTFLAAILFSNHLRYLFTYSMTSCSNVLTTE